MRAAKTTQIKKEEGGVKRHIAGIKVKWIPWNLILPRDIRRNRRRRQKKKNTSNVEERSRDSYN